MESIYRGADWSLRYLVREFPLSGASNGNPMNVAWPFGKVSSGSNAGIISPVMGQPGRRGTDMAGVVVLTSIAGTSASTNPSTLTASSVLASHNMRTALNFTVALRELPVDLLLYPYATTINGTPYELWFVTT